MLKRLLKSGFILMVILGGMSVFSAYGVSRSGYFIGPAYADGPNAIPDGETGMICYNFEDGQIPLGTQLEGVSRNQITGRVEVSSLYPYFGQYALNLDTNCGGTCDATTFTQQAAVFSFDLTPGLDTVLSFWVRNHNDEQDAADGVFIAGGGGTEFTRIAGLPTAPNVYNRVLLDLDEAAASAGQTIGSDFLVKFQSYDNFDIPSDGYSLDEICVCQEPQAAIDVQATRSGSDYFIDWNGGSGVEYEVWTAVNEPYFEPGADCRNPAPYQCQTASTPGLLVQNLPAHPDFSYSFAIVARNVCGQRTQGTHIGRAASISYSFGQAQTGDLAVTLDAPPSIALTQENYAGEPIPFTASYQNMSQSYTAHDVTLTQSLPTGLRLDFDRSTPGWQQIGGSANYSLAIGTLSPGQSGSAVLVGLIDQGFPAAAAATLTIAGSAAADPNPANNSSQATVLLTAGPDSDGDNLPDWLENGSMSFGGPFAAGTDPLTADTDGDGINDGDEVRGTTAGLDLPGMGTNPLRKNILIEYDWFDDALECAPHSHRPTEGVIQRVTAAFAGAPLSNPDGSTGIEFIHDYGQGGPYTGGNLIADPDGVLAGGVAGTEFKSYKAAQFAGNRQGYFHYVLLPHRYDTSSASSGQAELPGDDMIVSLFCYGSDQYVANTVMHELGHNLNLSHGGGDNINHKPNYNSVMNYDYQFSGVDNNCTPAGDGVLDFSRGLNAPLDEAHLDERDGICGGVPWDWNGNGSFEAQVAQDINGGDGQFYTLNDHNDWANLLFLGAGSLSNNGTRSMLQIDIISDPPLPSWVTNTGPVNQ